MTGLNFKIILGLLSLLLVSGCQLTLPVFLTQNSSKAVENAELETLTPEPKQATIATAIAPIIPNLSEEFLLQPEVVSASLTQNIALRSNHRIAEVQLFGDYVFAFSLPRKWEQTEAKVRMGYRRFEYAPTYKSVLGQDKLSIEAFQNYNRHYSAQQLIDSYVKRAKARCHYTALYEPLGKGKLNGFTTAEAIYGCAANSQNSQQTSMISYVMAVEAEGNMYLLNKRLKTKSFELSSAPVTADSIKRFLAPIQPIVLCHEKSTTAGCKV